MLLDSPDIYKIESRFISLFDRTFQKGVKEQSVPKLKNSVQRQFSSNTFKIQLDKIIDDLYLYTIDFTDKLIKTTLKADFTESRITHVLSAADSNTQGEYLTLTEEAVNECTDLADEIAESIIRVLKDEAIYQENPRKLASRVLDLFGGQRYRAENWTRTFSADVATSTTLYRFEQNGIEYGQVYATLDNRTSPQCRIMHGTIFKIGSAESNKYHTPFHHRCRTAIIPFIGTPDKSLLFENRDFSKPLDQKLKVLDSRMDDKIVKTAFKNIIPLMRNIELVNLFLMRILKNDLQN
jgi:SPP1 gp7 family putative phage head morphogenesis protein